MPVIVGTDSYVSEAELTAYATARGIVLEGDATVALIRAMDYLGVQSWAGYRTVSTQPLDFPRNGETTVPQAIKTAQMQLAIVYDGGADPLAPVGPAVKKETVDVLETEYQTGAGGVTAYPMIDRLIAPYLADASGAMSFTVGRA